MSQQMRSAGQILVVLALVVMSAGSAVSDDRTELEELLGIYLELKAEFDKNQAIVDNPDKHTPQDVTFAGEMVEKLGTNLDQLRQEIKSKGGDAEDTPKLKVKPGEPVTAVDKTSSAEVTKPTGSPCDFYPKFTRPDTSAYRLPPSDEQSGTKNNIAAQLLAAESALIEHSVECRNGWTAQSAADWAATREAFVEKLLRLETQYAMAFASGFTAEEDKLIGDAYRDSPRLLNLSRQEPKLYAKYIKLKNLVDKMVPQFKLAPDAVTRLKLMDLIHKAKAARTAWRNVANEWNKMKGREVDMLKRAHAARAERGFREMKKYHSGVVFEFHQKKKFLETNSALLKKLLGEAGITILEAEGDRRFKASPKPN